MKYTIEDIKKYAKNRNGECLSTEYKNNKNKLEWYCNLCKMKWFNCFKNVNLLNNWCPYCSGKYNNTIETVKELAEKRNGKCLSTEYKNNKTNLEWYCNVCKCKWIARLDRIKSGTWCPRCRDSRGEKEILNYLVDKNIKHFREYILKDLKYTRFDFYLPDYNIAIEFDGIQHFQICKMYITDEKTLKKRQQFDIDKTIYCIKNKIKLFRISYLYLNKLNSILDEYLDIIIKSNKYLFLTDWEKYNYIITKLDYNTEFEMFLTGVGNRMT